MRSAIWASRARILVIFLLHTQRGVIPVLPVSETFVAHLGQGPTDGTPEPAPKSKFQTARGMELPPRVLFDHIADMTRIFGTYTVDPQPESNGKFHHLMDYGCRIDLACSWTNRILRF